MSRYIDENQRFHSFRRWPSKVDVVDLVTSGFYYMGHGDKTQCFHCGIVIEHWNSSDGIDEFHLQKSKSCYFIRKKKGLDLKSFTTPTQKPIYERLNAVWSQALLNIGFSKPVLSQVLEQKLYETNGGFNNFWDYFSAVSDAHEILNRTKHD